MPGRWHGRSHHVIVGEGLPSTPFRGLNTVRLGWRPCGRHDAEPARRSLNPHPRLYPFGKPRAEALIIVVVPRLPLQPLPADFGAQGNDLGKLGANPRMLLQLRIAAVSRFATVPCR